MHRVGNTLTPLNAATAGELSTFTPVGLPFYTDNPIVRAQAQELRTPSKARIRDQPESGAIPLGVLLCASPRRLFNRSGFSPPSEHHAIHHNHSPEGIDARRVVQPKGGRPFVRRSGSRAPRGTGIATPIETRRRDEPAHRAGCRLVSLDDTERRVVTRDLDPRVLEPRPTVSASYRHFMPETTEPTRVEQPRHCGATGCRESEGVEIVTNSEGVRRALCRSCRKTFLGVTS